MMQRQCSDGITISFCVIAALGSNGELQEYDKIAEIYGLVPNNNSFIECISLRDLSSSTLLAVLGTYLHTH